MRHQADRSSVSDSVRQWFKRVVEAASDRSQSAVIISIRYRVLLFILLLIATAFVLSWLKTTTTVRYVVDREKVDLQDESQNKKLAIELALQSALMEVSNRTLQTGPVKLNPTDPRRGIRRAEVLQKFGRSELAKAANREKESPIEDRFDPASIEGLINPDSQVSAVWSRFYQVKPDPASNDAGSTSTWNTAVDVLIPATKADEVVINSPASNQIVNAAGSAVSNSPVLPPSATTNRSAFNVPLANVPLASPTSPNRNVPVNANVASREAQYWQVRFDLAPVVEDLTRATRQISYFLTEIPLADDETERPNDETEETDKSNAATRAYVSIGPNGELLTPDGIQAIDAFNSALKELKEMQKSSENAAWRGIVYPKDTSSWLGSITGLSNIDSVAADSMYRFETETPGWKLYFSESSKLPDALFDSDKNATNGFDGRRLSLLEDSFRDFDPFIRIDPLDREVGALRIRASSEDYLEVTKNAVEAYLKSLQLNDGSNLSDLDFTWQDTPLDHFVLSIQRVRAPGTSDASPLGYLINAVSVDEIETSAKRDLGWINKVVVIAMILAIVASLWLSNRLIRPLSSMTSVAQRIARLGKARGDRSERELEQLLSELPTANRTELGMLARQFEEMSRHLIAAKREAEKSAANFIAEQRKVEQTEREKAIASEVSQHRVQLLASVSHDMRQPLHVISCYADRLMRRPELDERSKNDLRTVVKSTTELGFLVEDILDYKRILAGDVIISPEPVSLDELLEEIRQHHLDNARQRNVEFIIDNLYKREVQCDRLRLKRILNNLVSNAVRATHDGEIRVEVTPMGSQDIEISVRDSGCGMDEIQQKLVFQSAERRAQIERQHRTLASRKDRNSTGLGLFITKQLVDAMGGDIRFTSHPGEGTNFIMRLPVAPPTPIQPPANTTPANTAPAETTPALNSPLIPEQLWDQSSRLVGSTKPVLSSSIAQHLHPLPANETLQAVVVDDDPRCTAILSQMLQDLGYEVLQVNDAADAFEIIADHNPDLVTLDVLMPNVDGWEVLAKLKASRLTEQIPVVMVTVDPNESKATMLGADGFVSKPIKQDTFASAVQRAIHTEEGANVLVVDDEPDCLAEMQELLEPFRYELMLACDGTEALEKLSELGSEPLDLAIIDLYMPGMDGFALIEKLRESASTRDVPIIVVTAGILTDTERRDLAPHVTRFFSKGSVDFATLRNEIARLVQKRDPQTAAILNR